MKRRVVLRISNMNSQKCRAKAMKIAVAVPGVESVSLAGEGMNEIVVTGERIDAVALANSLRKGMGFIDLLSVGDLGQVLGTDANNNSHIYGQGPTAPAPPAIGWTNDNGGVNYGGYGGMMPANHDYHNYTYDHHRRYNY